MQMVCGMMEVAIPSHDLFVNSLLKVSPVYDIKIGYRVDSVEKSKISKVGNYHAKNSNVSSKALRQRISDSSNQPLKFYFIEGKCG